MPTLKIIINKNNWVIKNNFYDILLELVKDIDLNDFESIILYFPKQIPEEVVLYLNRQNTYDTCYLCCYTQEHYCISFSINFINYLKKSFTLKVNE
jgi:hypothetical protein